MTRLTSLKVGTAFQFQHGGIVFVRCRGGYRRATGGHLQLIDPLWMVFPYSHVETLQ